MPRGETVPIDAAGPVEPRIKGTGIRGMLSRRDQTDHCDCWEQLTSPKQIGSVFVRLSG